jgi:PAS domain S-box-containing protein
MTSGMETDYREVVHTLRMFAWTCDASGACDYLSPQWIEYTGVPVEQQLGSGWLAQLHPDDRAPTSAAWRRVVETHGELDVEFRIRRRDGAYRWFKTRAAPVFDARGHVRRWVGSNTDVQELHEARLELAAVNRELEARIVARTLELQRANERLAEAQRISHVGHWVFDVVTGAVEWSEEMFRIVGRPPSGSPPAFEAQASMFTGSSRVRLNAAVARAIAEGVGYEVRLELVRPSGEIRVANAVASTEHGPDGRVVRLLGTVHDVTELVLAEEVRDASLERLRLATAAGNIGIWDWDVVRNRIVWDERMFALYGLPPRATVDYEAWRHAVHEDDRTTSDEAVQATLGGERILDIVFRVRRPSGECRHVRSMATVQRDAGGAPIRMLGVNWDVTAHVREVALAAETANLERSNRDLEEFAYAASHDLQEPLRAMSGCAQLLERRLGAQADDTTRELVGHIVDGAARMRSLITELLAYSRASSRGLSEGELALAEAVERARIALAASIADARAEVVVSALPTVVGDAAQLTQLFTNLLGNAIKYRSERPLRVVIASETRDDDWVIWVEDNGIGIEAAHFERIFLLFQRLHARTQYPGNGIGLALCQKIVERHGGRIWVESEPGQGSRFSFTLPKRGT